LHVCNSDGLIEPKGKKKRKGEDRQRSHLPSPCALTCSCLDAEGRKNRNAVKASGTVFLFSLLAKGKKEKTKPKA